MPSFTFKILNAKYIKQSFVIVFLDISSKNRQKGQSSLDITVKQI